MTTRSTTTPDGITIERAYIQSDKWDVRITVSHPRLSTQPQTFVSGGEPVIERVQETMVQSLRIMLNA